MLSLVSKSSENLIHIIYYYYGTVCRTKKYAKANNSEELLYMIFIA